MNKHRQIYALSDRVSSVLVYNISFGGKVIKYLSVCQIDKFFEQPQNKTSLGFIDTSPYAASTPSAEMHVMPLQGGRESSQMSDNDLFETTVSKHCQTLSEVSNLASSLNRPVESDYVENETSVEPVPPAPVSE